MLTTRRLYGSYKARDRASSDRLGGSPLPGRLTAAENGFLLTVKPPLATEKPRPTRVLLVEDNPTDKFLFESVLAQGPIAFELVAVDRL